MSCGDGVGGCSDHNMDADRPPGANDDPCNGSGEGQFCAGAKWYFDDPNGCPRMWVRAGETCGVDQWIELEVASNKSEVVGALAANIDSAGGSTYVQMPFQSTVDALGEWSNANREFTVACDKCVTVSVALIGEQVILNTVAPGNPTPEEWYTVATVFVNGVAVGDVARQGIFHDGVQQITASAQGSFTLCLDAGDVLDVRLATNGTIPASYDMALAIGGSTDYIRITQV